MGVNASTSNTGAVSSGAGGQTYDLKSWKGLTEVLKIARESGMSQDTYAAFRDMVLEYAQSGGDGAQKARIEEALEDMQGSAPKSTNHPRSNTEKKVISHKNPPQQKTATNQPDTRTVAVEHKTPEVSTAPKPQPPVQNSARPKPDVAADSTHTPPPSRVVPIKKEETPAENRTMPEPMFIPHEHHDEVEKSQSVPGVTEPVAVAQKTVSPPVVAPPPIPPAPEPPAPAPPVPPKSPAENVLSTPAAPGMQLSDYKFRIAEIKQLVNEHVGNPVTLMDPENIAGKAYMDALLSAMKAVGGGAAGSVRASMAALERTSSVVLNQKVSAHKTAPAVPTQVTEMSAPTVAAKPQPVPVESSAPIVAKEVQKDSFVPTPAPAAAPTEIPPATPPAAPPPKAAVSGALPSLADLPRTPVAQLSQPSSAPRPSSVESDAMPPVQTPAPIKNPLASSVPAPAEPRAPRVSLREQMQNASGVPGALPPVVAAANAPRSASQEPSISQIPAVSEDDPNDPHALQGPLVTEGLYQLLSEWSIFSSSGVFGAGPSGIEHPLYKRIAPLAMGVVASGRFEGSSPEILDSIKDYASAWQYEQGVKYTAIETFDHYLRRVVQRILKRQA